MKGDIARGKPRQFWGIVAMLRCLLHGARQCVDYLCAPFDAARGGGSAWGSGDVLHVLRCYSMLCAARSGCHGVHFARRTRLGVLGCRVGVLQGSRKRVKTTRNISALVIK